LWQEGQVVIGAGADTTANALTITHFHILNNPNVHKQLRAELEEALPKKYAPVELRVVDQLPYLVSFTLKKIGVKLLTNCFQNAVLNEGLRYAYCSDGHHHV
jgi:cytochrome P450